MNRLRYQPVKDFSGYNRDTKSGAVVYTNADQYNAFVKKKERENYMTDRLTRVEMTLDQILNKLESLEHLKND